MPRPVADPEPDSPAHRKARGAFFTPPRLCRYLVEWAVRTPADRVLEPSCGDAAFLVAATARLRELATTLPGSAGVSLLPSAQPGGEQLPPSLSVGEPALLHGIELHEVSAEQARGALTAVGARAEVTVADFFEVPAEAAFDAVIGNPPYVRYQGFTGEARALAQQAALAAGVRLTSLASSWAAFTVHAACFLRPGGRLALVLPAELLSVNYAAQVREFLMHRFARVRLVLFTERVFPGVQEEVVLLLAEGSGPTDHCELVQVRDAAELPHGADESESPGHGVSRQVGVGSLSASAAPVWRPGSSRAKWTPAMLPASALAVYEQVTAAPQATTLQSWGETTLGAVTGNNGYFAVSGSRVQELGLDPARDLVRISPPGSRHLRGLDLTPTAWRELVDADRPTWLFRPAGRPSGAGLAYIAAGERDGVPDAYKCRVRTPWWRVPLVSVPDLLLTCMNADTPRLVGNSARVHHLNSVHGVYLCEEARPLLPVLPLAVLNSLTLLGAELVGRAYGGGLLKLEPREADVLPVPALGLVTQARAELLAHRTRIARDLAAGRLLDAVARVDRVLLTGLLGLSVEQVTELAQARAALAARRSARAGGRAAATRVGGEGVAQLGGARAAPASGGETGVPAHPVGTGSSAQERR